MRRLLLLCCLLFISHSYARTIVLVFDDSTSMRGERVAFASYSLQNLIALLAPTDQLEVVRMREPTRVVSLLPDLGIINAIDDVRPWDVEAGTPYSAVLTAMRRIEQLQQRPQQNGITAEDYWLVIISDGAFNEFQTSDGRFILQEARETIQEDISTLRQNFENQKLAIVFLGIGDIARDISQPWEEVGALSFIAPQAPDISQAMFDIAALISGRDPEATPGQGLVAVPANGQVLLESALPLKRLLIFSQDAQPNRIDLAADSQLQGRSGRPVSLVSEGPFQSQGGGLFGAVTIVRAANPSEVLEAGQFQLSLSSDRIVELTELRFLPEVALDLVVSGPSASEVCSGETIVLEAQLIDPLSQTAIDLQSLTGLSISAQLEPSGQQLAFQASSPQDYSLEIPAQRGDLTVAVTARFPGYFNLRSERFSFNSIACTSGIVPTLSPSLAVPAQFTSTMHPTGDIELRLDAPNSELTQGTFQLAVELPAGITLTLAGQNLGSGLAQSFTLPLNQPIPLALSANQDFIQSGALILNLTSQQPTIQLAQEETSSQLELIPIELRLGDLDPVELQPRLDERLTLAAEQQLTLDGSLPAATIELIVEAEGLSEGLVLELAGQRMDNQQPAVNVPLVTSYPLSILYDGRFQAQTNPVLTLRAQSQDARLRIEGQSQLVVNLTSRQLGLETVDPGWAWAITDLNDSDAFALRPTANSGPVSTEEFAQWQVTLTDKPAGLRLELDRDDHQVLLYSRASWPVVLTPTGIQQVNLTISSPFGETAEVSIQLHLLDAPLWAKIQGLVIISLLLLGVIWLVIGYAKKRRFPRGAVLEYSRRRKPRSPLERNIRPSVEDLYVLKRRLSFAHHYLPYLAEELEIDGLRLRAGSGGTIRLIQPEADLLVNSEPIGERPFLILRANSELSRDLGKEIERYAFRVGFD